MGVFTDDFERADGGLGLSWVVVTGTLAISSGAVVNTGASLAYAGPISGPAEASAEIAIFLDGTYQLAAYPYVKGNVGGTNRYEARVVYNAGGYNVDIYRITNSAGTRIARITTTTALPNPYKVKILYSSGYVAAFVEGVFQVGVVDTTHAAETLCGFAIASGSTKTTWFEGGGTETKTLTVTPYQLGTESPATLLTLVGEFTGWTSGTPGTPIFTTSGGFLSDQAITSATTATVVLTPPGTTQTVTIYDPLNGIYDTITIVEGVPEEEHPAGWIGISAEAVAWLEAQAQHGGLVLADNDETDGEVEGVQIKAAFGELLIGKRKAVGESPYPDYLTAVLADLYARLWGGEEWQGVSFAASGTNAIKSDLTTANDVLAALTATYTDLATLVTLLGGTPTVYSNADLMTAIGNISGGDNQEVLDAIAAMQGDPLATIKACIDLVYALGTTNNWDLDDVKGWAEAIRGSGLPTIKSVMDKLGTSGNTIEARLDAISDLIVTQGTIQGMLDILLTAITGGVGVTLTSISDDILDAISNIPTATATSIPMWPGLANVTLGDAVALSDGLEVTGPMHGLLFTITGHPTGAGKYEFGEVDSWQHTGGVIFCSDNGDYERAESFGLERQIVVPRTMESAASATIRLNTAWSGTVRTWVRSV